jgi:hypothetical protein
MMDHPQSTPKPSRQTCRKGSEYNIAAYPSHILNNGIILNMCTPHMPLFQIGVTFFEYAVWLYSGMSAMPAGSNLCLMRTSVNWKVQRKRTAESTAIIHQQNHQIPLLAKGSWVPIIEACSHSSESRFPFPTHTDSY